MKITRDKKTIAKVIIAALLTLWVSVSFYTLYAYDPFGNDNKECGIITEIQNNQEMTGGKSKVMYTAIYGRVDYGQYGTWIMKLDPIESFGGVGSQYCISAKIVNKNDSANMSRWLEIPTVIGTAIFFTLLAMGIIGGLFSLVLWLTGEDDE